tara:strand:- start:572 stop:835 length:264 start_codon:yes stop_codon:yes gene_type:complete
MRKTFALPTLLSTTTALAMIAVLPAACADDTMKQSGEQMEGQMDESMSADKMTQEQLQQRVDALAKQMQQMSREMQTLQSQMRAMPR